MAACTTGQGLTALAVIHKTPQHTWKKLSDPSLFPIQRLFGTTKYTFTLEGQVTVLQFSICLRQQPTSAAAGETLNGQLWNNLSRGKYAL